MYNDSDLDSAVVAGALSAEAVEAFRAHIATQRATVLVDEESFRLITGFNDIFVVIAIALLFFSVGWIGISIHPSLSGAAIAAASWGLAEFFTRKRRMALPSIVLLLGFVGGIFSSAAAGMELWIGLDNINDHNRALLVAAVASLAAIAAYLHWRRFHVPITIAAGAIALVGAILALIFVAVPAFYNHFGWFVLLSGLGLFAFAMWWDTSDRERRTRRSDIAFWLHLAAAPAIAHPVFSLLGIFAGEVNTLRATVVVGLYIMLALVSLAIDRRAMLVSALAYVLYAINTVFKSFGAIELNVALTALVIGSALLSLSAFWHTARVAVVHCLPVAWQRRLPVLDRPALVQPR